MYDNFIWSGCSFSWGSGFNTFEHDGARWKHPDFSEYFNYGEYGVGLDSYELQLAVLPHTFPNLVGKKLGSSNIQNISLPGLGTTHHIRRITSYIEANKNILDFSKTFVGLQVTYPGRVDLIEAMEADENLNQFHEWHFKTLFNDASLVSDAAKPYYKHYFDFDYEILKKTQELLLFYRYLKSYNIDCMFYGMSGTRNDNFKIKKKDVDKVYTEFVQEIYHPIKLKYPNIDDIFDEIGYHETPFPVESLSNSKYNVPDAHLSPIGHIDTANDIYNYITNIIKK